MYAMILLSWNRVFMLDNPFLIIFKYCIIDEYISEKDIMKKTRAFYLIF